MGAYGKSVNIRMPPEMAEKFDRLAEAMPGLQRGNLLRLLLSATLDKNLEVQIKVVTSQLLKPEHRESGAQNRFKGQRTNSRNAE